MQREVKSGREDLRHVLRVQQLLVHADRGTPVLQARHLRLRRVQVRRRMAGRRLPVPIEPDRLHLARGQHVVLGERRLRLRSVHQLHRGVFGKVLRRVCHVRGSEVRVSLACERREIDVVFVSLKKT